MVWREMTWWIRLLEMGLPYSGELQHYQWRKLYLASKSET